MPCASPLRVVRARPSVFPRTKPIPMPGNSFPRSQVNRMPRADHCGWGGGLPTPRTPGPLIRSAGASEASAPATLLRSATSFPEEVTAAPTNSPNEANSAGPHSALPPDRPLRGNARPLSSNEAPRRVGPSLEWRFPEPTKPIRPELIPADPPKLTRLGTDRFPRTKPIAKRPRQGESPNEANSDWRRPTAAEPGRGEFGYPICETKPPPHPDGAAPSNPGRNST